MTTLSCKPCKWEASFHDEKFAQRVWAEHQRVRHTPVRWRDEQEMEEES